MTRKLCKIIVLVELDDVPGSFHTEESATEIVGKILEINIPHYNPRVFPGVLDGHWTVFVGLNTDGKRHVVYTCQSREEAMYKAKTYATNDFHVFYRGSDLKLTNTQSPKAEHVGYQFKNPEGDSEIQYTVARTTLSLTE